jgi:1,4-dihydroxy-2-naphthoate octaprenyltransferase
MTDATPGSIGAWIVAARPATLTAAFAPVAVGTACAWRVGGFRWDAALAALLGAFLIQIATFQKGADTDERLGPTRAAQAGLLTVRQLRRGIIVTFALALGTGVYLTWVAGPAVIVIGLASMTAGLAYTGGPFPLAGPAVIVIGLASMTAGLAYTGGPFPLAYNGLGDVFVMAFFGFVAVCGTAFVQASFVPQIAWAASVPIGALATGILVVNNVRDFEGDARAGKTTLVVRFGRGAGVREYAFLLAAAYATPIIMFVFGWTSAWVCLPLLTVLWAVGLLRSLVNERGVALNQTLAETAKLLSLFGVLFAIGIAL